MIDTAISLSTRGHFRILKSGHFNFLLTPVLSPALAIIEQLEFTFEQRVERMDYMERSLLAACIGCS